MSERERRLLEIQEAHEGERVDVALASILGLSRSSVADLLNAGDVLQGKKPLAKSDRLRAGDRIQVVMPAEIDPLDFTRVVSDQLDVIYDDADVVVVNKPVQKRGQQSLKRPAIDDRRPTPNPTNKLFQQPLGKTRRVESARDKTRRIFITPAIATKPRVDRAFSWLKARRHDGRRHHNYLLQLRLKCLDKAVKPPKPANGNRD